MKEIEVKAKADDLSALKEKLLKLGCQFSEPVTQEDRIFLPNGVEYPDIKQTGSPVVRVREANGTITLTLKKRTAAGNELIKLEKETAVNDKQETIDIVKHMGFHEVVNVNKKRIKCKHEGMTICLDEVAELGTYIEIEKLSAGGDDLAIQESLAEFLRSLGIDKDALVSKGYDTLKFELAAK